MQARPCGINSCRAVSSRENVNLTRGQTAASNSCATRARNKDTKVLIYQTVSRIRPVRFTHAYPLPLVKRPHARPFRVLRRDIRASRVPWHRPFPPGGGWSSLWARSIDRTEEMVLTLAAWPSRPRLSSLPSGVPVILTRHARSFHAKHEGRSYARILLIDAIMAMCMYVLRSHMQSDVQHPH